MNIKVEYFYGIYPSSLYGNLLLVDPLLPLTKCPLNCIICPLRPSKEILHKISIPPGPIMSNLVSRLPLNIKINGLLLWGYGDPLLLTNLGEVVNTLRKFLLEYNVEPLIYIHTSGLLLGEHFNNVDLLNSIEALLVPFLWYGEYKKTFGWTNRVNFVNYIESFKKITEANREKLHIELHIFKHSRNTYPDKLHLEEALIVLRNLKIETVILRPIDRPSHDIHVKPPSKVHVNYVEEKLEENGFKALINDFVQVTSTPTWSSIVDVLYNQVLRIPLKHSEIKALYGDLGIISINNLVSRGLSKQITWNKEVFFKSEPPRFFSYF